jgi:hypothetical protein
MNDTIKVKRRAIHTRRCSYAGKLVVQTRSLDTKNGEQVPAIGDMCSMLTVYNNIVTKEKAAKDLLEFNKTRCRRMRAEAKARLTANL